MRLRKSCRDFAKRGDNRAGEVDDALSCAAFYVEFMSK